jgi:predicted enzyme related to lactoylglutathione lyase
MTSNRLCWTDIPVTNLDRAMIVDPEGNRIALHSTW